MLYHVTNKHIYMCVSTLEAVRVCLHALVKWSIRPDLRRAGRRDAYIKIKSEAMCCRGLTRPTRYRVYQLLAPHCRRWRHTGSDSPDTNVDCASVAARCPGPLGDPTGCLSDGGACSSPTRDSLPPCCCCCSTHCWAPLTSPNPPHPTYPRTLRAVWLWNVVGVDGHIIVTPKATPTVIAHEGCA